VTRYIKSGTVNTVQEINSELERIQAAQVDFLARDGQAPNAMNAPLDMNSNRITNLPAPQSLSDAARLSDVAASANASTPIDLDGVVIYTDTITMQSSNILDGVYAKCERYTSGAALVDNLLYKITDAGTANGTSNLLLANGRIATLITNVVDPLMYGYNTTAADMTSIAIVQANWTRMKAYIADIRSGAKQAKKMSTFLSMQELYANWLSGNSLPMGFYSDSTTDGAKTTDHVPSTSSDASPFSVTINESPNAYPRILEVEVNKTGPAKTAVNVYNGGFDSESYRSGFGLDHWYNTWFRGTAGSNVNWSDVKMIVLGFGVSDSANIDNTLEVIQNYSLDLECTIVDCLLRGVQPVLQDPVLTVQHFGNTLNARNGDQCLTIIKAVQDTLAQRYNLQQISYSEPFQKALDGFTSIQYASLFSPAANDQVHPVDLGHRVMAGHILQLMNKQVVYVSNNVVDVLAGSPNYIVENEATNITTNVLTRAVTEQGAAVEKLGEYFYKFPTSTADEILLRLFVWVEKPTVLHYLPIDNSVEQPKILVNSLTHDDNATIGPQLLFTQPVTRYFTQCRQVAHLNYGLNQIILYANSVGGEQLIGGLKLVPRDLIDNLSLYRATAGGTLFLNKQTNVIDNNIASASTQDFNNFKPFYNRYNPADNNYSQISFVLNANLTTATDYEIRSHFNDHLNKADCYNRFVINTNAIAIYRVVNGTSTLVTTISNAGIGAAMVAGNQIMIRIRTRFFSPADTNFQIWSNGAQIVGGTAAVGAIWTTGYGLEMGTIFCRNASFQSIESLTGTNAFIS
jgi:hypothetical protein